MSVRSLASLRELKVGEIPFELAANLKFVLFENKIAADFDLALLPVDVNGFPVELFDALINSSAFVNE